jgi:hypothetical protein
MPPTVITTRGYFGSNFWSNAFFGSDFWKERVPVPVPPSGGGGIGMGGSGGPPIPQQLLRPKKPGRFLCPVTKTIEDDSLVQTLAAKVRKGLKHPENLGGGAAVDPDKITKYDYNVLKKKFIEYKEHVEHVEKTNQSTQRELSRLKAAAARMEKLLALAQKQIEEAEERAARAAHEAAIQTTDDLLAALTGEEFHAKIAASLSGSLDEALEEIKAQYSFGISKERVAFGLGAVLAGLATYFLVSDEDRTIKFIGYGAAAYLAARAVTK